MKYLYLCSFAEINYQSYPRNELLIPAVLSSSKKNSQNFNQFKNSKKIKCKSLVKNIKLEKLQLREGNYIQFYKNC